MMTLHDRATAKAFGKSTFAGDPCPTCGGVERYLKRGTCVPCIKAYDRTAKLLRTITGDEAARRRAWKTANPDKVREGAKVARKRHRQRYAADRALLATIRDEERQERRALQREAMRVENERTKVIRAEIRLLQRELDMVENGPFRDSQRRDHDQARNRIRKRRDALAGPHCNPDILAVIKGLQGARCAYCGDTAYLECDHKVSVANGGRHDAPNRQWLCRGCNARKSSLNDSDYRQRHGIPTITPWDAIRTLLDLFF